MKKLIPISLFVIAALCGCEGDWSFGHSPQTYYMPDSVKPLFNVGDTFYYYSAQNKLTDTLVINNKGQGFREGDGEKKIG